MQLLALRAHDLPQPVAEALRQSVVVQPDRITAHTGLTPLQELEEASLGLALSLGAVDSGTALARIAGWLHGPASRRLSAARLASFAVRRADDMLLQGMLVALANDPYYRVRAVAADALVRSLTPDSSVVCREAVLAAAQDAGCHTPHAVASSLSDGRALDDSLRQELHGILLRHPSTLVREAARTTGLSPS
ncbi:hypothetical protein [Streptomyces sp. BH105]|uniref:hypothetical protein n=1 Tax=Streptomyces sp. BH105 TaxID=3410408 RepID=UPI003CF96BDA